MSEPTPQKGRVRRWVLIVGIAGLALAAGIIVVVGWDKIAAGFIRIGWRGLIALCATYMVPVGILAAAWLVLDPGAKPSTWLTFFFARLVRDASGELLPFSSLGGFVFGARAAILGGVEPAAAISTTVVDVTAEFIGQLGFAALGVALLFYRPEAPPQDLLPSSLLGLGAGAVAAVAFILIQHRASGPIERWVAGWAPSALAQQGAVTASLHALYEKPLRLVLSSFLHFAAWVLGAVGVWAGLWVAGIHLSLRTIVCLESLVYIVRTVTFAVPMGLGVIEGGYAFVGVLLFGPEHGAGFAVALSLMKRVRDIAIGLPALAVWQVWEGRRLLAPAPPDPPKVLAESD
ncbi:MAG: lysylphosphatidylglycerol synthase domain-containing protein [Caulobacterales bacterium]